MPHRILDIQHFWWWARQHIGRTWARLEQRVFFSELSSTRSPKKTPEMYFSTLFWTPWENTFSKKNRNICCNYGHVGLQYELKCLACLRWGPYLQSCQWGFNMEKLKLSQISYPVVHCENRSIRIWTNYLYFNFRGPR